MNLRKTHRASRASHQPVRRQTMTYTHPLTTTTPPLFVGRVVTCRDTQVFSTPGIVHHSRKSYTSASNTSPPLPPPPYRPPLPLPLSPLGLLKNLEAVVVPSSYSTSSSSSSSSFPPSSPPPYGDASPARRMMWHGEQFIYSTDSEHARCQVWVVGALASSVCGNLCNSFPFFRGSFCCDVFLLLDWIGRHQTAFMYPLAVLVGSARKSIVSVTTKEH